MALSLPVSPPFPGSPAKIPSAPLTSESPCFACLRNLLTQIPRLSESGVPLSLRPSGCLLSYAPSFTSSWWWLTQASFSLLTRIRLPEDWLQRKPLLCLSLLLLLLLLLLCRHLNEPLPAMTHYPQHPPTPRFAAPIHSLLCRRPIVSQRGSGALVSFPCPPLPTD